MLAVLLRASWESTPPPFLHHLVQQRPRQVGVCVCFFFFC
jgi:hypothetical protein